MKLKKIEHIGIAVSNLEEAIKYWEEVMGLKCYNVEEVVDQKVKTAFFKIGDVKIELLEATSEESSIASFIEKKGQGVHHIAFSVDNTDQALEEVEKAGVKLIDKQARQGAECLKIGFLHPKSTMGILTEFCSE
ncbi:MAG: methylmalonyl-CoA epimerase [Bacteroidaceae bacterium]|jgi:methylmalonyl-CoA/ethylmalonyl-CoA epimerase|nr:methylmalonyl-CoA epimerase [Bacteroidaceae bacterium]MEA5099490.1 methylmalonyl-CoA epimerase [Bacteroidales bacterium]NCC18266.1 methylmalonyl-CoA epimerase [Bacteroidia bacterium]